jgi:hypothetical protein
MKLPKVRAWLLALVLFFTRIAPGTADPRHISLMPDPHGEFIRLCAPFQTSRYEHPEGVCDCLWGTVFNRIDNMQPIDAILYGIVERGVPANSFEAARKCSPSARAVRTASEWRNF